MGGTNDPKNLVDVSARQHFMLHLLLPHMVRGMYKEKTSYALRAMANLRHSKQRYVVGARTYSIIRTSLASTPMSAEQRQKISASLTGRALSNEHKLKISVGGRGKKRSPEFCAKISEINVGKYVSPETRQRIAASRRGSIMTDANKAALRLAHALPRTQEWNAHNSLGHQKFQYTITSPDGKLIEIKNLKVFCAENALPYSTFSALSRSGGITKSGWCVIRTPAL